MNKVLDLVDDDKIMIIESKNEIIVICQLSDEQTEKLKD